MGNSIPLADLGRLAAYYSAVGLRVCQGRLDFGERNLWSLVASGCTRLAAPLLWAALRVVPGTDDEGGVL